MVAQSPILIRLNRTIDQEPILIQQATQLVFGYALCGRWYDGVIKGHYYLHGAWPTILRTGSVMRYDRYVDHIRLVE